MNLKNTALILIDIQKGFDDTTYWKTKRNNIHAEANAKKLLETWRSHQNPIFHIQHCTLQPNSIFHDKSPGFPIKDIVKPKTTELIIRKYVNSAFIGTNLKQLLDKQAINTIVFVGLTTDHCISTSARMAGNFGYKTYVVSDATATFGRIGINNEMYDAEIIHLTSLASLKNEFSTIVTTQEIVESL